MSDTSGKACELPGAVDRPSGSVEHAASGQPLHDLTGANVWVPWILASTVLGSPNHDPQNAALLGQGPSVLTLDLEAGLGLDAGALLAGVERAMDNLERAAAIVGAEYDAATGHLSFTIRNDTGHKLITGYPEGRRMFVGVRGFSDGAVVYELNPFDADAGTLRGLPGSPASPPLLGHEVYDDRLVYEVRARSALTGEDHTFHIALATERTKDNRIPPRGFRVGEAAARMVEPIFDGVPAPSYFTPEEYAGGHDDVALDLPPDLSGVEVSLYYQTTSREYVEFLRDEILGSATTLSAPTPSGEPSAYVAQSDPFFAALAGWGDTLWQLWEHNREVPGAAPVLMARVTVGGDGCEASMDGSPCDDGDPCTLSDVCEGGVCGGSPKLCEAPSSECRTSRCDATTGGCVVEPLPEGEPCSIGQCRAGICLPPEESDDEGCGCRLAGAEERVGAPSWLLVGAIAAMLWRTRARRRAICRPR